MPVVWRELQGARGVRVPRSIHGYNRDHRLARGVVFAWASFGGWMVDLLNRAPLPGGVGRLPVAELGAVCPSLDGSTEYWNVGDHAGYDRGSGDFAVEGWLYPTTISTTKRMEVLSKDSAIGRQFSIEINGNANSGTVGALRVVYFVGGGNVRMDTATNVLVQNTAHHFVAQRKAAHAQGFELWVDGIDRTTTKTGTHGSMNATSTNANIGRREYSGFNDHYAGAIPLITFRDVALESDEIAELYARRTRWAMFAVPARTFFLPAATAGASVSVPAGTLALTASVPSVATGVSAAVPAATLTLTAQLPSIETGVRTNLPAGTVTLTAALPGVRTGASLQVPAATLDLTGFVPFVTSGVTVSAPSGSVALTGALPTVATGVRVSLTTGTLTLAARLPSIIASQNTRVSAPSGAMTLSGLVPSVHVGASVQVPAGLLAFAGRLPALRTGVSVAVPTGAMLLSAQLPAVVTGDPVGKRLEFDSDGHRLNFDVRSHRLRFDTDVHRLHFDR